MGRNPAQSSGLVEMMHKPNVQVTPTIFWREIDLTYDIIMTEDDMKWRPRLALVPLASWLQISLNPCLVTAVNFMHRKQKEIIRMPIVVVIINHNQKKIATYPWHFLVIMSNGLFWVDMIIKTWRNGYPRFISDWVAKWKKNVELHGQLPEGKVEGAWTWNILEFNSIICFEHVIILSNDVLN